MQSTQVGESDSLTYWWCLKGTFQKANHIKIKHVGCEPILERAMTTSRTWRVFDCVELIPEDPLASVRCWYYCSLWDKKNGANTMEDGNKVRTTQNSHTRLVVIKL